MVMPLLTTKLHVPTIRPKLVSRPRLIERLAEGLHARRKLTLISAPAGFGKTTLAGEWVAGCERPAAWLSLDDGDNDSTRFLAYLVAALKTIAPNIGEGVLNVLHAAQPRCVGYLTHPFGFSAIDWPTFPKPANILVDSHTHLESTTI